MTKKIDDDDNKDDGGDYNDCFSAEEIEQFGKSDLLVLSEMLGDKVLVIMITIIIRIMIRNVIIIILFIINIILIGFCCRSFSLETNLLCWTSLSTLTSPSWSG